MATERQAAASLSLSWCFGFNKDITGGIHSIGDESRHAMVYVAAHTGIIYDYAKKTQILLQGHCNPIQCVCVSEDKRWIVTADYGEESMMIVWDSLTGSPIKTISDPHPSGVVALDISPDAMFLVTLSHVSEGEEQQVSVWEWSSDREGPLYTTTVATDDVQTSVRFNCYDIREIVSNGSQRVIFWNWSNRKLEFFAPPLAERDFHQKIGAFTQSIFVPDTKQAITGTEDGDIVLWDHVIGTDPTQIERQAVKLVRISGTEGAGGIKINYLTEIDGYLAVGTQDGAVRFYDFDFRLVAWYEDLNAGPITSISFANTPVNPELVNLNEFVVPKFLVGTTQAFIIGVDPAMFNDPSKDKRRGALLAQGMDDEIHGLSAHPQQPLIALSCYGGSIQLWNFESKRLIKMRAFDTSKLRPHSLAFSPDGNFLAAGFTNGVLKILNPLTLQDILTFRESKAPITILRVSSDSRYLSTADLDHYVAVWQTNPTTNEWIYIGRCKSHSDRITGLEFSSYVDQPQSLVSIGLDRKLVEYNVSDSSMANGLLCRYDPVRVEQTGTPTACLWHPELSSLREDLLIIANDEFKMKQWNTSNRACRSTSLGPTYGEAMNRFLAFPPSEDKEAAYCVYSTPERVLGLLKLPIDGNPNKSIGLIAHPCEITDICLSSDASYLFSAGGSDLTVNMWSVYTRALDKLEKDGGGGVRPYLSLLEGGASGEFYNEIVDYFYYCQLRAQGEDATSPRDVKGTIPIVEIPQLMRALGYYPSEEEIQTMCSEMKYKEFTKTTELLDAITLDQFIKLYINYRPVFGIGKEQIQQAFAKLGADPTLPWSTIKEYLLTRGETLSPEELSKCLGALVADELPTEFDALSLAENLYGFEDYELT